jgi:hypothetical protein
MTLRDLRAKLLLALYLGAIFAGASFLSGGVGGCAGGGNYEPPLTNR